MSCSVQGCTNHRRFKPEGISFHVFPRSDHLLKVWLKLLKKNIETWTWSKHKVVCSLHFSAEDFIRKGGKIFLKPTAIPNITGSSNISTAISTERSMLSMRCDVSDVSQVKQLKRKISNVDTVVHESSTSTDSSEKRRKVAFINTIHNYSVSPRKIKKKNEELRKRQVQYRKKLHAANKNIVSLEKEVTSLKAVVQELRQQQLKNLIIIVD